MKNLIIRSLAALLTLAASGQAATLLDVTSALQASDATQLGRLSRDGTPSDWSAAKAFPGVVNASTSYRFLTFTVNVGITPFIQISIDDPGSSLFTAAYLNAYNPASLSTGYLGDAGVSGNPFPGSPNFFQVNVPVNQNVVIVVGDTSAAGAGVGQPFGLLVEGFLDTSYTEPSAAVPEPSTVFIGGAGLLVVMVKRLRTPRA